MTGADTGSIDRIIDSWNRLLEDFPGEKEQLLEELGRKLLAEVQQHIGGSGKVQGWQGYYIGSGRAYAAVRAKAETWQTTGAGKQYAAGYITNAIEGGHRHRRPGAERRAGYTYRPRIRTASVAGRKFYARVRAEMGRMGREELARLAQNIIQRLEGGA